jgi:hypothetical protein
MMMKMKIVCFFSLWALLVSCNEQNGKQEKTSADTNMVKKTADSIKTPIPNHSDEYVFKGGDSITVSLRRDSSTSKKLLFVVEAKNKKFEGAANLELIEDNGKFYLPESTPRLDEKTNQEYMCDSTFSYQSEKISFVFAMENRTKKRLSFIINNSAIEGIEDNFYTLYREK